MKCDKCLNDTDQTKTYQIYYGKTISSNTTYGAGGSSTTTTRYEFANEAKEANICSDCVFKRRVGGVVISIIWAIIAVSSVVLTFEFEGSFLFLVFGFIAFLGVGFTWSFISGRVFANDDDLGDEITAGIYREYLVKDGYDAIKSRSEYRKLYTTYR